MSNTKYLIVGVIVFTLAAVGMMTLASALYTVDESEYALELRFGEVKNVRRSSGLYMKAPFIDSVQFISKRTLRADVPPREVPDQDKERLIIDFVVRYQIVVPVAFRKTLRNEETAKERISVIMFSAMRDTIAENDRTEVIGARALVDENGLAINDEEGLPVYESLAQTRDRIGEDILNRIRDTVENQRYGVNIIGADIKRADFPSQVTESIINKLRTERKRVAARHRADGEEEYRRRTSAVQKEADILLAEARRDARQTRGEGDAEAIRIAQEALTQNPEFYAFLRSLESYQTSIQPGATVVLTDGPGGYLDAFVRPPSGDHSD